MHIASGKYEHRDNGFANGITETWHYGYRTANTFVMQVVFEAHYTLRAEVYFDENQRLEEFSYHIDEHLNGNYRISDGKLLARRTLPGNTRLEDTLVWSDNAVLDLPFLSCKGHTILHLKKQGLAPTFAPIFHSGDRAGDLAKKSVREIGKETIKIGEKSYSATHYHYMHDYWLDKYGRVLKVQDKNNNYEMILVEYTS